MNTQFGRFVPYIASYLIPRKHKTRRQRAEKIPILSWSARKQDQHQIPRVVEGIRQVGAITGLPEALRPPPPHPTRRTAPANINSFFMTTKQTFKEITSPCLVPRRPQVVPSER